MKCRLLCWTATTIL